MGSFYLRLFDVRKIRIVTLDLNFINNKLFLRTKEFISFVNSLWFTTRRKHKFDLIVISS